MKRNCSVCNKPISKERLEALPEATTCTKHSKAKKKIALTDYDQDNNAEITVVEDDEDGS